jgi:hypothetical protein
LSRKKLKRNTRSLDKRRNMMKSVRRYVVSSPKQITRRIIKKFKQGIFPQE